MKVIKIDSVNKTVVLVPRVFLNEGDILEVTLRNEIKNKSSLINHTWNYSSNYFTLELLEPIEDDFYEDNTKYELSIKLNNNIIYKGKLIITPIEDIQNFKHAIITVNNKLKF